MDLADKQEPVTVRLLQGPKGLEVVRLASAWCVRDATPDHPKVHTADAHGVIPTAGPSPSLHPVLIYTEGSRCSSGNLGPDSASVVDIVTNKVVDTRFPQVCWLPHSERRDGTLVTFLHEVPRRLGRINEFFVVLQVPGRPGETTAAWMSAEDRQQCYPLDDGRKKAKFSAQLVAFRSVPCEAPDCVSRPGAPFHSKPSCGGYRQTLALRPIVGAHGGMFGSLSSSSALDAAPEA